MRVSAKKTPASATEVAWLVGGLLVFASIAGVAYLVVILLAGA